MPHLGNAHEKVFVVSVRHPPAAAAPEYEYSELFEVPMTNGHCLIGKRVKLECILQRAVQLRPYDLGHIFEVEHPSFFLDEDVGELDDGVEFAGEAAHARGGGVAPLLHPRGVMDAFHD